MLASKHGGLLIQTHLAETSDESSRVTLVHETASNGGNQGLLGIYETAQLLTRRTVFAHAIHLSAGERQQLRESGAGVAHCPNANISVCHGVCPIRTLRDEEIRVGLGTDIANGSSSSVLDAMRWAVQSSKCLAFRDPRPLVTMAEAFYMATLGGADVLGLREVIGSIEVGKDFDALIVDLRPPSCAYDAYPGDGLETLFDRFLWCGDDRNIQSVYVRGRLIHDNAAGMYGGVALAGIAKKL